MARKKMAPLHPGEVLVEEFLKPLGMSANALAKALGVSAPTVNDLCRERRRVTVDTALRLGRYFRTTPEFWMGLQTQYDFDVASDKKKMEAIRREITPVRRRGKVATA